MDVVHSLLPVLPDRLYTYASGNKKKQMRCVKHVKSSSSGNV